jgi:signal transduction histidine kinase
MVWNWLRRHPWIADWVVVVGLAAGFVGRAVHLHRYGLGVLFAVLEVLPLGLRRHYPRTVLAVVTAAGLLDEVVFGTFVPVAVAVAIYTVAAHLGRRAALVAAAAAAAPLALSELLVDGYPHALQTLLLLGAAWVIGDNLGTRRAYLQELQDKADRLEREQEAQAARAVAEEQARIARELHDVVAHSLSVMVVQAAAANDVFASRPDRVREALAAIEATGRSALGELRSLLGSVQAGAEFAPAPTLERLDELVEQVRRAGLEVVVRVEGDERALPAAVELSAYRIVQEALTNTLKHARASRVEVGLRYADERLDVDVRDDGRGSVNGDGGGQGLVGMRARAAVLGGTLEAGPRRDGGFAVSARLPLGAAT